MSKTDQAANEFEKALLQQKTVMRELQKDIDVLNGSLESLNKNLEALGDRIAVVEQFDKAYRLSPEFASRDCH